MTTSTTTTAPTSSSYASTSYHTYQYIPTPEDYNTSTPIPLSLHTTNDPIILPPLPVLANPVLTTPYANRARRAQNTSPSHLSRSERISSSSHHPYSRPASPSHPARSAQTAPPPRSANVESAEPDPAQALNDLHYLSSLTAAQRAELYRRSRVSSSPSSSEQGWFSYLPSILNTLKSRCSPSTIPTSSLPTSSRILESYTALTHLLASERLENAKLKRACEVLKRQVREVSARCCALEAMGFGGNDGSGAKGKGRKGAIDGMAKGKRGVKRRREDSEEGKRTSPSSRSSTAAGSRASTPRSTGKQKRSFVSSLALSTLSTTLTNPSSNAKCPVTRKTLSPPRTAVIEPPSAQIPIKNLPEHTRKHHPSYQRSSNLHSPISLSVSHAATGSSLGACSTSTPTSNSTSTSVTSRTSTPHSLGLGLTLKPLRYDDGEESDSESLPTPSYLPIPFLSQQSHSSVPGAKTQYDTLVEKKDTRVVQTAPATPEDKHTALSRPPTPPKRVNSAGGRIQSRAKVVKPKSTSKWPETFEITPSPSPATAVDEDEEQEKEKERKRERSLLDLMFVNTGREIECRGCRINTTYPRMHTKHIHISQIHTFVHSTTEQYYFAHLDAKHTAEWGELKRLSEREVGMLRGRLGIPGSERREEKGGYMDLTTGEFVLSVRVEEDVRRDIGMDEVPEVRPRKVDITPSHLIMRMTAKQREGLGMVLV